MHSAVVVAQQCDRALIAFATPTCATQCSQSTHTSSALRSPSKSPVSPSSLLQRFVLLFFLAKCSRQLIDILLILSPFRHVGILSAESLLLFLFHCVPCNSCSSCSHMGCCHCFDKYKQDDVDEIAVRSDLLQAQCRPPCLLISCTAC